MFNLGGVGGVFGGAAHASSSILSRKVSQFITGHARLAAIAASKWGARFGRVLRTGLRIAQEYLEIVGEVIIEMVFDNMLNLDEGERPMGGATQFMTLMTLSVLTSGLLSAVTRGEGWSVGTRTFNDRTIAMIAIGTLGVGLSIAQAVARIPVLQASAGI